MLVKIHETLAVNPELVSEVSVHPGCIQVVMADGTEHRLPFGDTETNAEAFNRVTTALYSDAGTQDKLDRLRADIESIYAMKNVDVDGFPVTKVYRLIREALNR